MASRELLADVEVNGLHVRIEHITDPDGGHAIELSGLDCDLQGEMPGLYYVVPFTQPNPKALCVCGHTAHWHSHRGAGDCEHDGRCRCQQFRAAAPATAQQHGLVDEHGAYTDKAFSIIDGARDRSC
jgi:hypothetical protein